MNYIKELFFVLVMSVKDYVGVAFSFMFAVGSIMLVAYTSTYFAYHLSMYLFE
jgi:hypothetical protein